VFDRVLQHVDQRALEIVPRRRGGSLVEAADRQRDHVLVEGARVLLGDLLLDAAQADAGDARGHAGEELRDQRARQADRLEVVAAAVGRQDRDAHLGHDLEQALVQRLLEAARHWPSSCLPNRPRAWRSAIVSSREVGVDRRRADADQHGE
jgi:hypothetical protein